VNALESDVLNFDKTVNLDLEGIETVEGGFWVVNEGSGIFNNSSCETPNLLLRLDENAVIEEVVLLPDEVAPSVKTTPSR
jgi:hypothetical protein